MTRFYPNINKKEKGLTMYRFWLKVTKRLHRLGWFRLSKVTASFMK